MQWASIFLISTPNLQQTLTDDLTPVYCVGCKIKGFINCWELFKCPYKGRSLNTGTGTEGNFLNLFCSPKGLALMHDEIPHNKSLSNYKYKIEDWKI